MAPTPKPPGMRQRRNRETTHAVLPSAAESAKRAVPDLPKRDKPTELWHPKVVEWWTAVWTSPMADEYLGPDIKGGLYLLAELYQQRWTATTAKDIAQLAAEIRQQEVRFGLSPIDRRRLQWEVEKGETADERTKARRKVKDADKQRAGKDPRDVLKVV